MEELKVELKFSECDKLQRVQEPVTLGIPFPRGLVKDDLCLHLLTSPLEGEVDATEAQAEGAAGGGDSLPLQTQVLDRWPDGSIRWCLSDFRYDSEKEYAIRVGKSKRMIKLIKIEPNPQVSWSINGVIEPSLELIAEQSGFLHRRYRLKAKDIEGLKITGYLDDYPGLSCKRVQLTVTNPNPADHPGGNWDLGNGGSVILRELFVHWLTHDAITRVSNERGQKFQEIYDSIEITQESSGGENWKSEVHLNRHHIISHRFNGYHEVQGAITEGKRATPVVQVGNVSVTMPKFWENFPKSYSAHGSALILGLFPHGEHEIQGGEQKTHVFWYSDLLAGRASDGPSLEWARSPVLCHASPEWYARCEVVPYLTASGGCQPPVSDDETRDRGLTPPARQDYEALVNQAIEGPDTFIHKREKIDDYGWRNFGDIYGDHEAVRWTGESPMVSHYNNQYDCVGGFAYQFLRSGDPRWFDQMIECADHTCDIDVYHTKGDKAAYNGGLFWHTYHYAPADTSTHRSYPRNLRTGPVDTRQEKLDTLGGDTAQKLLNAYAVGGGPSASHLYVTGLTLAYFMTGNPLYRDTAVSLAEYVINIENPRGTVFRWLSQEYTGLATDSQAGYHGPGRASGNSLLALLDGHRMTGERRFLDFAEMIIRRVVHPQQDLSSLNLLNAELRWFYTMFLQALGRYLDYKIELNQLDGMYAYGRETLLHYVQWMAANERPILDTPEKLQYPNETWAAQDMRKVEVFQFAAKHVTGEDKKRYLERAEWFFDYVVNKLHSFPTKSLCRPVVLMLNFGWSREWWKQHPDTSAPAPTVPATVTPPWAMFVPQKTKAIKRAKMLIAGGALVAMLAIVGLLVYL